MQLKVFENVHPWRAWQVYKLKRWMSDDNRSSWLWRWFRI